MIEEKITFDIFYPFFQFFCKQKDKYIEFRYGYNSFCPVHVHIYIVYVHVHVSSRTVSDVQCNLYCFVHLYIFHYDNNPICYKLDYLHIK